MSTPHIDQIISYSQISEATHRVDSAREIHVLLSERQAGLFRKHMEVMCNGRGFASLKELLAFHLLQLQILALCPRVFELALFYKIDPQTPNRVNFSAHRDGILVTFPPHLDADGQGR